MLFSQLSIDKMTNKVNSMKQKVKKILEILFGTQKNLTFKFSLASLMTSIILFLFLTMFEGETDITYIFLFSSSLFFAMWLETTKSADSALNFIYEFVRLYVFFAILILSLNFFIHITNYNGFLLYLYTILACVGIFLCSFYLVSKVNDVFNYIKKIFSKFKDKLYDSTKPATTKLKAFIENITAFLAAVGALTLAVKTITDTIIDILNSLK